MIRRVITSVRKLNADSQSRAQKLAEDWGMEYIPRWDQSIPAMFSSLQLMYGSEVRLYVVSQKRVEVYMNSSNEPYFFHPNTAMFRAKHYVRFGEDPLVNACKIEQGDTIVDATLGLGSDAQLLSLAAGKSGRVIGLEASEEIARITSMGLAVYEDTFSPLIHAMRRIQVITCHHLEWLKQQPTEAVDVIYFDPMFEESVTKSDGISALKQLSIDEGFTKRVVEEAVRVAKKRVVMKDHFKSKRFEAFGFDRLRRKSSTVHYGVIEKNGRYSS